MSNSKKALSAKEQDIYFTLANGKNRLFTTDMLKDFGFTDYATLKELLSKMTRKGWLTRVKKGTYILNDPRTTGIQDILSVATYVFNGYLAFSSALYVYHAITERPYTIYVATRVESKSKVFGEIEVKAVALDKRALGMTKYEGYTISTKAKTLYDCFHLPEYAGGYSKVVEAVSGLHLAKEDWNEFLTYVNNFETNSSKRRIGYLLELANKAMASVPTRVINSLRTKGGLARLGAGKNGKYIKEWRLFDYLGEDYILGWAK